ncbi:MULTISPECIES: exopolyphosphatase [Nitrosomonas]|uniref:Exopolyphosphatase n=1 Tax=Nitrosomonas europaea (strain ATCC 19718 / CIP 103999 / KCTC 2705 / NBRC 14298) TaxID=228410 RepID=Q82TX4_NITEU|nr:MULTISPECIES: exopolyphosphatase [Nitrosomonas]CAD85656.1 Ppx/GppA phosphatase [Nitrosomonas europaea ATCC 19718]SDW79822.1 Ppx/GppA phosphatase [Nitrosomonas europaea]SET34294.1 Ppx/GppA phosphatase [Nitrosomonas europaea]SJZ90558.1 Ppx/GppA phosphatase [Nitrosomonas europaea]HBF25849.1 exopolyphosphatase [Nitrosomonas sp.]
MHEYSTLAAVDLGSNSFHLQVARIAEKQLYLLDSLKEMVQLAAGLSDDQILDEASQNRALACLERFGQRLRGFPHHAVRVVGTNSLRVARNAADFLRKAENALGFPIEIIAGHEEARLIYLGVVHSLPISDNHLLVVDIGGGSTELIIGNRLKSNKLESLPVGCINHSLHFFPDGKITKGSLKQAELAARTEIQAIAAEFSSSHWQKAYGSSGTARALAHILTLNGYNNGNNEEVITLAGLEKLREFLLKTGDIKKLEITGLNPARKAIIAGGFAIMSAVFTELNIDHMAIATGALREGVLYDMLGRFHKEDTREISVQEFMQRYRVDPVQAARIESLAVTLGKQLLADHPDTEKVEDALKLLSWAARLHEIGISVAHTGYHKHSAYILDNADIPGFSKMEQSQLSQLVLSHHGSLVKTRDFLSQPVNFARSIALRIATIFYRSRTHINLPDMTLSMNGKRCTLLIPQAWLERNPLTGTLLNNETETWAKVDIDFRIENRVDGRRTKSGAA